MFLQAPIPNQTNVFKLSPETELRIAVDGEAKLVIENPANIRTGWEGEMPPCQSKQENKKCHPANNNNGRLG